MNINLAGAGSAVNFSGIVSLEFLSGIQDIGFEGNKAVESRIFLTARTQTADPAFSIDRLVY